MAQVLKEGGRGLSTTNWEVYSPEGRHMFTCGERKAEWYLDRDLAIKFDDFKIKLTFQPKGSGFDDDEIFGLAGRNICCVVDGETGSLQRHHIVPYCYRSHFPDEYKSKNHHDVVLISADNHSDYESIATKYKNELAIEYDVKSLNEFNLEYTRILSEFSDNKVKMLSKLHAIFKSYGRIPVRVIIENLQFVADNTDMTYEFLSKLSYAQLWKLYTYLRDRFSNEFDEFKLVHGNKYDHGYHLVQKLKTHDEIKDFVRKWRMHFIDTMKPKYMPEGWSVDFKVKVEL
jgi:hypothetical protein